VRVEVAQVLGFLDRVAGELHPDVLPPVAGRTRRADQVAHDAAVADRRRARGALRAPGLFDLGPRRDRVLEAFGQRRLGPALALVPRREQASGVVEVLVGEGDDFEPSHAT
jgi:hypothetical protein